MSPKHKKKTTIPKVVKLDPDIKDRLDRLAEIKDRSSHWLIKEAVTEYVVFQEQNEKLKQETLARWKEAESGKVVNNQAVEKWLDSWGTEHEEDKPK